MTRARAANLLRALPSFLLALAVTVPPYVVAFFSVASESSGFGYRYLDFAAFGFLLPAVLMGAFVFVTTAALEWFWGAVFGVVAAQFVLVFLVSAHTKAGLVLQTWAMSMLVSGVAGLVGGAAAMLPARIAGLRASRPERGRVVASRVGLGVAAVALVLWVVSTIMVLG